MHNDIVTKYSIIMTVGLFYLSKIENIKILLKFMK